MPSLGPSSSSRSLATVSKMNTHASRRAIRLANCSRAGLHGQHKGCNRTWHARKMRCQGASPLSCAIHTVGWSGRQAVACRRQQGYDANWCQAHCRGAGKPQSQQRTSQRFRDTHSLSVNSASTSTVCAVVVSKNAAGVSTDAMM